MTGPGKGILILANDGRAILVKGRKMAVLVHYCDILESIVHKAHGPNEVWGLVWATGEPEVEWKKYSKNYIAPGLQDADETCCCNETSWK